MQARQTSARPLPPKERDAIASCEIPLNAFPGFPSQWQQGGRNWQGPCSQLHTPNPAEFFSILIPGNICCGRSQAFYCFQLQTRFFCIIHFLPAAWAHNQSQTRSNTRKLQDPDSCSCTSKLGPLMEYRLPPPSQVLWPCPPSSSHWSTPVFLFWVPLPAPKHLPNCSVSQQSPGFPWKPQSVSSSETCFPHPACSTSAWETITSPLTVRIAQQDLSFSSATTRAFVGKLGATVGKGVFELGPSALLGFKMDDTHQEWSTVTGKRNVESPCNSGYEQLAEQT